MPHHRTEEKCRGVARRKQISELLLVGHSYAEIAEKVSISPKQVRLHALRIIASESKYPSDLTPPQVSHLRSVESERLDKLDVKLANAMDAAVRDSVEAPTAEERSLATNAAASAHRALVGSSEARARLLGLNVPTKTSVEMWQFSMKRSEQKIVISFDASPLLGEPQAIEGMTMFSGGREVFTGESITEVFPGDGHQARELPLGSVKVESVAEPAQPEPVAATPKPKKRKWGVKMLPDGKTMCCLVDA
jgi:hypothetical protein